VVGETGSAVPNICSQKERTAALPQIGAIMTQYPIQGAAHLRQGHGPEANGFNVVIVDTAGPFGSGMERE